MTPIHDRMPAILNPADEARWLDLDVTVPEAVMDGLRPYPAEALAPTPPPRASTHRGMRGQS